MTAETKTPTDDEIGNVITLNFMDRMQLPAVSVDDSIKCARMLLEVRGIKRAPIPLVFDDGEGSGDT